MKVKSIYLAGAMGCFKDTPELMTKWRYKATKLLNLCAKNKDIKLEIINPTEYFTFDIIRHKSEKEIMEYDLWHVTHSDLILVNLVHIHDSPGTIIELYEAKKSKIPVVAFSDNFELHPWIKECINRIENNLEDAVKYIDEFYL